MIEPTFRLLQPPEPVSRFGDLSAAVAAVNDAALVGEETEAARKQILDFCRRHHDALHRSCLSGHLTGSAFVVDAEADRALVLHHAKLDRWLQPGGHADGDGNLAAVALREAGEETGIDGLRVVTPAIDIDVHVIPERAGADRDPEPEHLHLDVRFLVLAPTGAEAAHNHEALDARWVGPGDDLVVGTGELARGLSRAFTVAAPLADGRVRGS